jgi:alkylation response protein AidB-like acyl-CoA dehydrogenase
MDFGLSEEQQAIFDMAHAFGQEHIAPFARQWEADGTIPKALWAKVAELGLGGIYVSEDHGGSGLTRLDATLVFEALAMACRTRADKTNEGYRMNGTKAFISGGGYSDVYVVMCRTGEDGPKGISTLIVEDGTPGLSFGGLESKMGWRSQPTAQVQFDDCLVPLENRIGDEGRGFVYAMAGLDGGRLNIAASALGGAQAALDATITYMGERKAFGKTIDQFQGLQFRLAECEVKLQSARTFLRQAAWKLDNGAPDATKFCAMAKMYVTDAAFDVANQCLQLHGGYGYLADYGIEKIVRDLRVHQILEGTNEIMRVIIARSMLAGRA